MALLKKKPEFKKLILALITAFCMGCVVWSYVLASVGSAQVNESLASSVFATVVGSYVGYVAASFGEKNSRNKYNRGKSNINDGGEKGDN